MEKKETEKFIEECLNSEKPDRKVLSAAKQAMLKNNQSRSKLFWAYCLAACSAILIGAGIILATINVLPPSTLTLQSANNMPHIATKYIPAIVLMSFGMVLGIIAIILLIKYIKRK